jgi:putative ABC transport system permease protein
VTVLHRLARALLSAALPPELRDAVIGDLDDEMRERIDAGATRHAAAAWSMRQSLGSIPAALRLRAGRRMAAGPAGSKGEAVHSLWQDVRYAARVARKTPLVTIAAVTTLALGIGATTAIFSIVHAALIRELPFHEPDRIVNIYESFRSSLSRGVVNPSNFDYWERHATSFSHITPMRTSSATLTGAGDPTRVSVQAVGEAFFDTIGVRPAVGRQLNDSDADESTLPVLLSHELWRTRFGADPAITSRTIMLNDAATPVVGVMPAGFGFPHNTDVWMPLRIPASQRANARSWFLGVVARLRPGIEIDDARAEMNRLAQELQQANPARQKDRGASLVPLREDLVFRIAEGVLLLQGAVALVLLIAVANIANLLLARGAARTREFGIRTAVGASRWRVARLVLTESVLLGLAGAVVGCVLAVYNLRALLAFSPLQLPPGMEPALDMPVLMFGLATGVAASALFGLLPALAATRRDVAARLQAGALTSGGSSPRSTHLRSGLVIAELALAVVLLVGAGLLARTFLRLMSQDVGFTSTRVLTAMTTLPAARYDTAEKRSAFWESLFERLATVPGVVAAGGSTAVPFSNFEWQTAFTIVGRVDTPHGTSIRTVHPKYFEALGIPLLAGRVLSPADNETAERVVMVNGTFARTFFPGVNPVGERIRLTSEKDATPALIVGVAGDTRHYRLTEPPQPEVYRPLMQQAPSLFVLAIRTSDDPRAVMSLVRSAVRQLDPDLPIEQMKTLSELVAGTVADRRFYLTLIGFFALAALMLALIGVYAVMAYVVGQRSREIGIRLALGAAPRDVRLQVVRSAAVLVLVGLALGAGAALLASRALASLLFGVAPHDPLTFAAVVALLGLLGVAAAWLPARRAARLDPLAVLRTE